MVDPLSVLAPNLSLSLDGSQPLDVRSFHVEEGMSRLFHLKIVAMSSDPDFDFEGPIGKSATFQVARNFGTPLVWQGVCARVAQLQVEETGLSTYEVHLAPTLWLLTQRRNYRIFQDQSELDIVLAILGEWGIAPDLQLDAGSYGKRRYRAQYAESDFHFVSRLLEDIGVAYSFSSSGGTTLVLSDAPNKQSASTTLPFTSSPNERTPGDFVTDVVTARHVRPGRYTQSDVDYRKPLDYPLAASTSAGGDVEQSLERYHHNYGSLLWKGGSDGGTPFADDRGPARTDESSGATQVEKRLDAQRVDARRVTFRTTAFDLRPGSVFSMTGHPRGELGSPLLVVATVFEGDVHSKWNHRCEARYTDVDFRPQLVTPKPRAFGVESATVTGPSGEEIHTDEFGRVRVKFHWDRDGQADETSSCWIPVNQPWAGAGFGALNIPRVGQEVIIDFLGGDPDRPVVMGRVFTTTTPPPYELPKYKMVSGMRSETYPRAAGTAGEGRIGGGPLALSTEPASAVEAANGAMVEAAPRLRIVPHRAPVGGGELVAQLGGATTPASGATPAQLPPAQPGAFGAFPAPPGELQSAITRMQAPGPDKKDHNRNANGMVIDDTSSKERVYIQAQKNMAFVVKGDMVGSVAGNRAFTILGNDWEDMPKGFQATHVAMDRTVKVDGMQSHQVTGDINIKTDGNHLTIAKKSTYVEATEGGQVYKALLGLTLMVGGGDDAPPCAIVMTPSAIVINAPKVFINPGPKVMHDIFHGISPEAATDAAARAARVQAMADNITNFFKTAAAGDPMMQKMRRQMLEGMVAGDPQYNDTLQDWAGKDGDVGETRDAAGTALHDMGPGWGR